MDHWLGAGSLSSSAFIDLHTHTLASDGQYEPNDLINRLYPFGIKLLSLTDHETMFAFNSLKLEHIPFDFTVLYGIEFTTRFNPDPNDVSSGANIDILAYGLDPHEPNVKRLLLETEARNNDRMQAICQKLSSMGVPIDFALLEAHRKPNATIHISLITEILIKSGYIKLQEQNILDFVNNTVGKHVLSTVLPTVTSEDMIKQLHQLGAVVIIAHPGQYPINIHNHLQTLPADGIEIHHPANNSLVKKHFEDHCNKNNLLKTGGSDFHGWFVPDYPFNSLLTVEYIQEFCQILDIEVKND